MIANDFRPLQDLMRRWDSRRRQQELLHLLPRALAVGLLLGLIAGFLSRTRPLLTREELGLFALATTLMALLVAGLVFFFRRHSPADQAQFADRQFELRERVTTAVEIQSGQLLVDTDIASRQLNDAIAAARTVDLDSQYPLRIRLLDWLPALVAAILMVLALSLPNPQEAILLEQRALAAIIEDQRHTLETLAEEIASNDSLTAEQIEALQKPIQEVLAALQEPDLSREEAVAALSQTETDLRSLSQEFDTAALQGALAEAAASLGNSAATSDLVESLNAGQLDRASSDTGELADRLGDLNSAERTALAEQLAAAASDVRATNQDLADSLDRAAEALAADDITTAQEALGEAAAALSEQAQSATAASQAVSAAEQLAEARGEIAQGGTESQSGGSQSASGSGQSGSNTPTAGNNPLGNQEGAAGGPSEGGGHAENVFVPGLVNIDAEGENLELEAQCLSDPESCGPLGGQTPSQLGGELPGGSLVPYDQVFGDYRNAAFEALRGGNIPVSLQGIIRDYFSALEP